MTGRRTQAPLAIRTRIQPEQGHIRRKIKLRRLDEGLFQRPQQIKVLALRRPRQRRQRGRLLRRAYPFGKPGKIARTQAFKIRPQRPSRGRAGANRVAAAVAKRHHRARIGLPPYFMLQCPADPPVFLGFAACSPGRAGRVVQGQVRRSIVIGGALVRPIHE
ncbi:hypothetical protein D3C85_1398260 [compost metagenome]